MDIGAQVSLRSNDFTFFGQIPRSSITRTCSSSILIFEATPIFFPWWLLEKLCSFLKKIGCSLHLSKISYVWIYFGALASVPLVYVPVFMPVPHCFDDSGLVIQALVSLISGIVIPPALFFFLKIAAAIWGL